MQPVRPSSSGRSGRSPVEQKIGLEPFDGLIAFKELVFWVVFVCFFLLFCDFSMVCFNFCLDS